MVALPELESPTVVAVRAARQARQRRRYPSLGIPAGTVAEECDRRIWYALRWTHEPEVVDGQLQRLFETGEIEETRIINDLRLTDGITVEDRDPETGKQFAIRLIGGHVRGKTDGKVLGVVEAPKTIHVLECKSHNDKSFKEVKRKGVREAKPLHYGQMQTYMHAQGLDRALYYAVNKDTDEEHSERVEYDPLHALEKLSRAERIVLSDRAPTRQFEDPQAKLAWKCGTCPANGLCHAGDFAPRNCRTCLHVSPQLDGDARWFCERHKRDLTSDDQRAGCANHLYLPDLVPGDQVDADEAAETITYRLTSGEQAGREWVDGFFKPEGEHHA